MTMLSLTAAGLTQLLYSVEPLSLDHLLVAPCVITAPLDVN